MLGGVDDWVDAAVEEDDCSGPRDERLALRYDKSGTIRCDAQKESTHNVEQVLGDLDLPPADALSVAALSTHGVSELRLGR